MKHSTTTTRTGEAPISKKFEIFQNLEENFGGKE
jgi:hypothetical protein